MDSEKLKQFMVPILIVVVAIGLGFYLGSGTMTNLQKYMKSKGEVQTKQTDLKEKQEKLQKAKQEAEEEKRKEQNAQKSDAKQFYRPVMSGLDTEAVIAGEFTEILELVRVNKIKVRAIKYDYDPQDDNFVKNAGAQYNVARLNMEIVANYTSLDNFLKELYKHEHFLDIQSLEIVPYKKNKSILLVNFKLKLYSKK